MNLYSVAICGAKFFLAGNLSNDSVNAIDEYCRKKYCKASGSDRYECLSELIKYIEDELFQSVRVIHVEHIFRINSSLYN